MKKAPYHFLRVGLAITFLWIGVLILKEPVFWSGFIHPVFLNISPFDAVQMIYMTAVLDLILGLLLLIDKWIFPVSITVAIHLFVILIVAGIDEITVRDIGLIGGALALIAETYPAKLNKRVS